jgi:hypothetical protein
MYLVSNGILSRSKFPLGDENVWQHHEHFSNFDQPKRDQPKHVVLTTIIVLLSALRKLSLSTNLSPKRLLYRGTSGRLPLPDCFWGYRHGASDASSVRGYLVFGFQSFTSKRDIAIRYSGTHDASRPFPVILKFKAGAIDRGADVSNISQYPMQSARSRIFPPPFSFVAPDFDDANEVVKESDEGCLTKVYSNSQRFRSESMSTAAPPPSKSCRRGHLREFSIFKFLKKSSHALLFQQAACDQAKMGG